jgi:hypothetical protein
VKIQDLKSNAVLADLHVADFDLLSSRLRAVSLKQGAILQAENEPVGLVHFPLTGTMSLTRNHAQRHQHRNGDGRPKWCCRALAA